jgi:RNA polymerase sigma factor (sigma-70 family)
MSGTHSLLLEYIQKGSERAFRELVASYINLVFSTALRIVGGDRPMAEDVTQTVFADLARKADLLPKNVRLGGWLHRHTCFVARKALRRERRRVAREQQAVRLHGIEDYTEANLAQLALVLDEAINELGEQDRNAIVLRFFEELDFRSIAESMGGSEDAARMRVSRAVEKMGSLLKRRGVVLSVSGLAFVLTASAASAASAGLATRVSHAALFQSAGFPSLSHIFRKTCFTRLNIGIISAAMLIGLLVLLVPARHHKPTPNANAKTMTPAEFANLGGEETEAEIVPPAEASPAYKFDPPPAAPSVQTLPVAGQPVRTAPDSPIVVEAPRWQPSPAPTWPVLSNSVPTSNSGVDPAFASAPRNQNAPPWRPQPYYPSYPQSSARVGVATPVKAGKESKQANVGAGQAVVSTPRQPWSVATTVATIQPEPVLPNAAANVRVSQQLQPAPRQRSTAPGRVMNDSRKRDRQP